MRIEIPEVKRCCCCLPLRRGLIAWVYTHLITSIFSYAYIYNTFIDPGPTISTLVEIVVTITVLLDVVFDIIFLISAHRKSFVYLRIYYRYAIIMLILYVIGTLLYFGFELYLLIDQTYLAIFIFRYIMLESTCYIFLQLVMKIYFIILLRSELLKLEKNNVSFQFVNHTTEPECTAQVEESTDA